MIEHQLYVFVLTAERIQVEEPKFLFSWNVNSLDLECLSKAHKLQYWFPACAAMQALGGGA